MSGRFLVSPEHKLQREKLIEPDYLKSMISVQEKNTKGRIKKGARLEDIYHVYNQQKINVQNTQGILVHKQKKKDRKLNRKFSILIPPVNVQLFFTATVTINFI